MSLIAEIRSEMQRRMAALGWKGNTTRATYTRPLDETLGTSRGYLARSGRGDRFHPTGIVVSEKAAALMPDGLSPRDAAAIPLAGLTALQGLRDLGGLRAGQRVLVTGATGGVGHFAVQIAAARGAHVTAVASSAKAELARELGAETVVDYAESPDYAALGPFDIVFDCAAKEPVARFARALSDDGVLVSTLPSVGSFARTFSWPLCSRWLAPPSGHLRAAE